MDPPPQLPEEALERRRRLGLDRRDELWDGELHLVLPPSKRHQSLKFRLGLVLLPFAEQQGLELVPELGFYRVDKDYRVPDLVAYRPDQASERGLEGRAELVVEIVSPGDESRAKLPWYAARGVSEVVLIDRDTLRVELYVPGADGRLEPALHTRSAVLDCTFERVDDDRLRIVAPDGTGDIVLLPAS